MDGPFHASIRFRRHEDLEAAIVIEHFDEAEEDVAHLPDLASVPALGPGAERSPGPIRRERGLSSQVAGFDGEHDAGGKNRIDEAGGVPDQKPAGPGILEVAIGIIAGEGVFAHAFRACHAPAQFGAAGYDMLEAVARF